MNVYVPVLWLWIVTVAEPAPLVLTSVTPACALLKPAKSIGAKPTGPLRAAEPHPIMVSML